MLSTKLSWTILYFFILILLSLVSEGAFDAPMPFMNADPISHSGGYAENIDKSGLIRGRIVEESLMGRNAARRFQQEINEIVQDNVPLCFLPLWKKITIKMQKVIKKHFKKQNLLVRWDKKRVLTSEPAEYTQNAFMVEYFTQPAEHEIQNLHLAAAPTNLDNGLETDEWETGSSLSEDLLEAGDYE